MNRTSTSWVFARTRILGLNVIAHLEPRERVKAVDHPQVRASQVRLDERLVHRVDGFRYLVDDILGLLPAPIDVPHHALDQVEVHAAADAHP